MDGASDPKRQTLSFGAHFFSFRRFLAILVAQVGDLKRLEHPVGATNLA
jgi:hypothetical protein